MWSEPKLASGGDKRPDAKACERASRRGTARKRVCGAAGGKVQRQGLCSEPVLVVRETAYLADSSPTPECRDTERAVSRRSGDCPTLYLSVQAPAATAQWKHAVYGSRLSNERLRGSEVGRHRQPEPTRVTVDAFRSRETQTSSTTAWRRTYSLDCWTSPVDEEPGSRGRSAIVVRQERSGGSAAPSAPTRDTFWLREWRVRSWMPSVLVPQC